MPKKGAKGAKSSQRRGRMGGGDEKRELQIKEPGQEYAKVLRMLGNGRLQCYCYDGVSRMAHIRGSMRKKMWVQKGDIILISKRDFQDARCDVIHRYSPDEGRQLKAKSELPETAIIGEVEEGEEEGEGGGGGGSGGGGISAAVAGAFEFDEAAGDDEEGAGEEIDLSKI